jgi:purine-nucleoside phosphorylase
MNVDLVKRNESAAYIRAQLAPLGLAPTIACVLGSGLGEMAEQLTHAVRIPYAHIPHFPISTVAGHAGQLVVGRLEGRCVLMMQGRFHLYEGYSPQQVVYPVYVMQALGVQTLLLTNAAGGMNRSFKAGDLMVIEDHLNVIGDNPLIGHHEPQIGVRFPDMSTAYDRDYIKRIFALAPTVMPAGTTLQRGVYAGISGPTYMTPAELRMLALMGADALGMSTVAEAIAAAYAGMRVLGISCITDMALADELEPLTHEQVVAVANRTKPLFMQLLRLFIGSLE